MKPVWLGLALWLGGEELVRDTAVEIRTFRFREPAVEVSAGTRVTWTNQDAIEHTVTSGVPDGADGAFGATLAGEGSTFGFTFDSAGTYPYFCARHQFMRGEIRVLTLTDGAR
ncbi:MAG: plastocyanin/azurin family copper-binding protein [Gemmatimonadales bacterium]